MLSILAPASAGTWQTREAIPLPWSALGFPHPAGMAQAFEEGWVVSGDRNMSHIPVPIILSVIFFSHFFLMPPRDFYSEENIPWILHF